MGRWIVVGLALLALACGTSGADTPPPSGGSSQKPAADKYKTLAQQGTDTLAQDTRAYLQCGDSTLVCRDDLNNLVKDVQNIRSDLSASPVPDCLTVADAEMRAALNALQKAYTDGAHGYDLVLRHSSQAAATLSTASTELTTANQQLSRARDLTNRADCS